VISHRAEAGRLIERADAIAAALLAKPPEALRATQRLLRQGSRDEILERMEVESRLFGERLQSQEVKDAIAAFFAARGGR
jgi:enoyl-CoA hydratase/carnithine racemase